MPGWPRAPPAERLIERGAVRVDGEQAHKALRLAGGELIELDDEVESAPAGPEAGVGLEIPLALIDDHVIVADKPAGWSTHPAPGVVGPTLVAALRTLGLRGGDDDQRPGRDSPARPRYLRPARALPAATRRTPRWASRCARGRSSASTSRWCAAGRPRAEARSTRRSGAIATTWADGGRGPRRAAGRDALRAGRAAGGREPAAPQARDGTHASDPRAPGRDRPPGARRSPVRRAGHTDRLRRQFLHAARLGFSHPPTATASSSRAICRLTWRRRSSAPAARSSQALPQSRGGRAILREHRDRRDRRGRDGHEHRLPPRAARCRRPADRQAGSRRWPVRRVGGDAARPLRGSRHRGGCALRLASSWPTCWHAPAPTGFVNCGYLAVGEADREPRIRRAIEVMRAQGVVVEQLDNAQIRALEPRLAAGALTIGAYEPTTACASAVRRRRLREGGREARARLAFGSRVTAVRPDGEGFLLLCADGRRISADRVGRVLRGLRAAADALTGRLAATDLVRVQAGRFRRRFPFARPGRSSRTTRSASGCGPTATTGITSWARAPTSWAAALPHPLGPGRGGPARVGAPLGPGRARLPGRRRGIFRGSWASWLDFTPDGNPVVDLVPAAGSAPGNRHVGPRLQTLPGPGPGRGRAAAGRRGPLLRLDAVSATAVSTGAQRPVPGPQRRVRPERCGPDPEVADRGAGGSGTG